MLKGHGVAAEAAQATTQAVAEPPSPPSESDEPGAVLSAAPVKAKPGSSWLGSPAVRLRLARGNCLLALGRPADALHEPDPDQRPHHDEEPLDEKAEHQGASFAAVSETSSAYGVHMRTAAMVRAIERVAEFTRLRGIYP